MKRGWPSVRIALVLLGATTLSACEQQAPKMVRDHYASLEDCAADWGRPEHCERVLSSGYGGAHIFRGPPYALARRDAAQQEALEDAQRDGRAGLVDPARQGRAIGTVMEPAARDGARREPFPPPPVDPEDSMDVTVVDSLAGLPYFVAYFGVALIALTLGLAVYVAVAARREMRLIVQGNVAAAAGMAGAVIGFALPLTSALIRSETLLDMLVWAGVALLAQLLVVSGIRLMLSALVQRVHQGQLASGLFLAAIVVVLGLLNAAAVAIAY